MNNKLEQAKKEIEEFLNVELTIQKYNRTKNKMKLNCRFSKPDFEIFYTQFLLKISQGIRNKEIYETRCIKRQIDTEFKEVGFSHVFFLDFENCKSEIQISKLEFSQQIFVTMKEKEDKLNFSSH